MTSLSRVRERCHVVTAVLLLAWPAGAPSQEEGEIGRRKAAVRPRMSYLDNGEVKVGVDLSLGGAVTHLSRSGRDDNVVNSWDWGRQIQMSSYAGPHRFRVEGKRVAKPWEHFPWNPVQAGDHFGNPSRVTDSRNDGRELYARCVPMQWSLDGATCECDYETWLRLDGPTVRVRCRLTNRRADRTQYPALDQEWPAVYVNGPYHRLLTYTGDRPFTGGELTRVVKEPGQRRTGDFPWSHFLATENWAALVNDDGRGLGVWQPRCYRFIGGFAGKPGQGGPHDVATGYVAPLTREILDHNVTQEYGYTLILGTVDEIRKHVYAHARRPAPPVYRFTHDRQGWHYRNAVDAGWPIRGELKVSLTEANPQLVGPDDFWQAADAPTLAFEAALPPGVQQVRVYWATHAAPEFAVGRSLAVPVTGDDAMRTYRARLADAPGYRGAITRVRLDPLPAGRPGQWLWLRSVALGKGDSGGNAHFP